MNFQNIPFASESLKPFLYVGLTLLIAVISDYILRSLIKVPKQFDNRRTRNATTLAKNFISVLVFSIALYTILAIFGVNIAPLLASASIIGIIIGIGARSTIEDFVTGLFFLSLDSLTIGDYVKIGDTEGFVDKIGARTVTIKAIDGSITIIPNSQVKTLINFSRHRSNVIIDVPVKSNQLIEKVLGCATDALNELKTDHDLKDYILTGSRVNGIEHFAQPDIMTIRITIIAPNSRRFEVGRAYRLRLKLAFEKQKLLFA